MQLPDGTVRKKRRSFNEPGHYHEITCTCYRRMRLLGHDRTRKWLLEALDRVRRMHEVSIVAYVMMPEHFHAVLWPRRREYSMAVILKSLKQGVARRAVAYLRANAPIQLEKLRVAREGGADEFRFWQQGGGYDRNLWSERSIGNSIRYIHENPVRAGLVEKARDWEWSSARAYLGEEDVVLRVDVWR